MCHFCDSCRVEQTRGKRTFPEVVERGPTGLKARATIHFTPSSVGGKLYPSYTVIHHHAGKRHRQRFSRYERARAHAEEAAIKLSNGEAAALDLTGHDRKVLVNAREALVSFDGCTVERAIDEYAQARKLLGGTPILEAVRFYER